MFYSQYIAAILKKIRNKPTSEEYLQQAAKIHDTGKRLLRDEIARIKAEKPAEFEPTPFHSVIGDFISIFFNDIDSYSERINEHLTLYKAIDTGEITGCKIKGVSLFMKSQRGY